MKKSRIAVLALLVFLCASIAGTLFSFVYVSFKDLARQQRLNAFQDFERQEKELRALENEYREWQELPDALKKFHERHILSLDAFAAFRVELDSCLAANQLQPPSIDISFGKSRDNIKRVGMKFSLTSSYQNLKKFVFDMEGKSKMHFIRSLTMAASGNAVRCSITLEVYLGD